MPQSGFSFDVTVTTKDDSAAQHSDYNALSDTATFSAGDFTQVTVNGQQRYRAEKEFAVSVNDDTIDEPDESFTVTLDYLNSRLTHLQGGNSTARVTITDDDHVPVTLGWEQAAVTVNEGTGTVTMRAVALTTKDKIPDIGFSFDVSVSHQRRLGVAARRLHAAVRYAHLHPKRIQAGDRQRPTTVPRGEGSNADHRGRLRGRAGRRLYRNHGLLRPYPPPSTGRPRHR